MTFENYLHPKTKQGKPKGNKTELVCISADRMFDKTNKNIYSVLFAPQRREMLKRLETEDLSYSQLGEICKNTRPNQHKTKAIAYHIKFLTSYHLVEKLQSGVYHLTDRGLTILRAMNKIDKSEKFI